MNLIFLDIDGVFVTGDYIVSRYNLTGKSNGRVFDPSTINRFNKIIETVDPDIVISSTWRMGRSVDDLSKLLLEYGFKNARVVGKTITTNHGIRGIEIQEYLNQLSVKPFKFCIIDDDTDMEHLMPYLIKTEFNTGITDEVMISVINYFSE